jgi:hypothetical protein
MNANSKFYEECNNIRLKYDILRILLNKSHKNVVVGLWTERSNEIITFAFVNSGFEAEFV